MDDFDIANQYLDAGEPEKAIPHFEKSAAAGRTAALHSMGHCNLYGIGLKQDYGKAFQWFTRAAGQGCPQGKLVRLWHPNARREQQLT